MQLGGSVSTKELLAAREDAERRAEMGQAGPAAPTWAAPGLADSDRPSEAARAPAASNGAPGSAKDAGASAVSAGERLFQLPLLHVWQHRGRQGIQRQAEEGCQHPA